MRRGVVLAALFLALASSASASDVSSLRVVSAQPLQVRGSHFRPAERVTVRVAAGDVVRSRIVRASPTGAFTATFATVSIPACTAYLVTAQGNAGSRAMVRRRPFVDCAQP